MTTDWRVDRYPATGATVLTITDDRAVNALVALGVGLDTEQRYALAAQLLGYPEERLPGYVPAGKHHQSCGRSEPHVAHAWALDVLWCNGDPA